MTYRGHIRNGTVVLNEPAHLPEGAEVMVDVLQPAGEDSGSGIPSVYERLKSIVGKAKGLPPDAAQNVDHYLYGARKK